MNTLAETAPALLLQLYEELEEHYREAGWEDAAVRAAGVRAGYEFALCEVLYDLPGPRYVGLSRDDLLAIACTVDPRVMQLLEG